CGVAASADGIEAGDLRLAHGLVVDIEDFDMIRLARLIFVDPDDDLFAAVDPRLAPRRRFLDAQFRHAALDRAGHAAEHLDLLDQPHRRFGHRMGQALDVIAAAERIDYLRNAGL